MSTRKQNARARRPRGKSGAVRPYPIDLDRFLPFQAHRLSACVSTPETMQVRGGISIRAREWRVLVMLACRGSLTNAQIARAALLDAGSVTRATNELVTLGLVRLEPDPHDARKAIMHLTARGQEVADELGRVREAFSRRVLAALAPDEQAALFAAIDRLVAAVHDHSDSG